MNTTVPNSSRSTPEATPGCLHLAPDMIDFISRHERIVDLGCGGGQTCVDLARSGWLHVTGVDRDASVVARARRFAEGAEVAPVPEFVVADVTDLPFPDNSFTVALMRSVLTTIIGVEDRRRAVREAARVLAPGGQLCLVVFAQRQRDDRYRRLYAEGEELTGDFGTIAVHDPQTSGAVRCVHHFSEDELAELLAEAGFDIDRLHHERSLRRAGTMAVIAVNRKGQTGAATA